MELTKSVRLDLYFWQGGKVGSKGASFGSMIVDLQARDNDPNSRYESIEGIHHVPRMAEVAAEII